MTRSHDTIPSLPLAIRVYPVVVGAPPRKASRRHAARPEAMLVFDTETSIDATQRLLFGSYRFILRGRCLEEGLFVADDLPQPDRDVLRAYVRTHRADVAREGVSALQLLTIAQFIDKLFEVGYAGRGHIVGFNLPFDLSRIAQDVVAGRRHFAGGFSLGLGIYADAAGQVRANHFRPRIGIKHIDSKRALIGFTSQRTPDPIDQIPDGSATGLPEAGFIFYGHFLDLKRLAFALTDKGYSLASACEAFDVTHVKQTAHEHGHVTRQYIDYNRRDVLATWELAVKLMAEYERHPIALSATQAYSPAALGKAYLAAMGIPPVLVRQPDFPLRYIGYAQAAFYGGRTSAHIRRVPVPVVYTDFLSMYPTVNRLMDLWRFVTAARIEVIEHCQAEIEAFLYDLTLDALFDPKTWPQLTAFVRVVPDGDVLPSRAQYGHSRDWQVAINHLHAGSQDPNDALWYPLPDLVASVIKTGKVPRIVDAFRIMPMGQLAGLTPTRLHGAVPIDPRTQDFFQVVIEERKRLAHRSDLSEADRARIGQSLKVLSNATSYGIYAEMLRRDSNDAVETTCYGLDPTPFTCRVSHPEQAGEYCFPPFAALITAAARLMLAALERCVTDAGGTYAMEDTDSMAIVATEHGELVACPGGPHRLPNGRDAVQALSWAEVRAIEDRFAALNPYDRTAVTGSILKIEDDNFDPKTGAQRQLYCFAISAKRYSLFVRNGKGEPILLRKGTNSSKDGWSEHGLGHLLNPLDSSREDRDWIAQVWRFLVRRGLGLRTRPLAFANAPAVGRVTVSSPVVIRPLAGLNVEKAYPDQIKPFNFLLTCSVRPFGHPPYVDATRFHLIAPYESDASQWLAAEWTDQYSGSRYRITTHGETGERHTARVKTYGEVVTEYEHHPEWKSADTQSRPCSQSTIGLLQRRHVRIGSLSYIGKESNLLEEVESGLSHEVHDVYTLYPDPRRDEWLTKIVPALHNVSLNQFEKRTGKPRKLLIDARTGRRRPQLRHQRLLVSLLHDLGLL